MKLTLTKEGQFAAKFSGDLSKKCDLNKVAVYFYEIELSALDDHLSPEGFIVENSRIQRYFEDTYAQEQPAMSCENIARRAAQDLGAMLAAERVSVQCVRVKIKGSNNAVLGAEWEP